MVRLVGIGMVVDIVWSTWALIESKGTVKCV